MFRVHQTVLFRVLGDSISYLQAAASAADVQNMMILCFDGFWLEMGGLVHLQLGLLCGAALPGAFFKKIMTFLKKHEF